MHAPGRSSRFADSSAAPQFPAPGHLGEPTPALLPEQERENKGSKKRVPAAQRLPRLHSPPHPGAWTRQQGPTARVQLPAQLPHLQDAPPNPSLPCWSPGSCCSPCPNLFPSLPSSPAPLHASCKVEHCLVHTDLPPRSNHCISCWSSELGSTFLTIFNPPIPPPLPDSDPPLPDRPIPALFRVKCGHFLRIYELPHQSGYLRIEMHGYFADHHHLPRAQQCPAYRNRSRKQAKQRSEREAGVQSHTRPDCVGKRREGAYPLSTCVSAHMLVLLSSQHKRCFLRAPN